MNFTRVSTSTKLLFLISFCFASTFSNTACNRVKQKAKEGIHKTGETVGSSASEFISGVSKGVDESFGCTLGIQKSLLAKGIKAGKYKVNSDSTKVEHVLVVYLIFEENFTGNITAKLYDHNDLEYGRSSVDITAKKGEAKYYDFNFDSRTNIESKSKIILE